MARTVARLALRPITHNIILVTPHAAALCVVDTTPLLALLLIH